MVICKTFDVCQGSRSEEAALSVMSDEVQFDEFGNLINGNLSDSSDEESQISPSERHNYELTENEDNDNAIVLAEDRTYYPTLSSTFDGVETIIATADEKTLNDPIVEPYVEKKFMLEENDLPDTTYSKRYMWEISKVPERIRNVAFCGNIHAGKTSLIDMLVEQTHMFSNQAQQAKQTRLRYTDNHILEAKRGISIKSSVMSLLLPDLNDIHTLVNIVDSPGHSNFCDEMAISIRLADVAVLCVDAIESVTKSLELVIEYALRTRTKMMLVVTKIDRLILELRLSPLDAYYKIRRTIEQVNETIEKYCHDLDTNFEEANLKLSPELGNVCFSSSTFNIIFSLSSFAQKYFESNGLNANPKISTALFARKLWGDIYYENNKFFVRPKNPIAVASSRTFIKFILAPIYKMTTASLTLDPPQLRDFAEVNLGLNLKKRVYKLDTKPFMKELFGSFFGPPSSALVSCFMKLPSPRTHYNTKMQHLYEGAPSSKIIQHVNNCDLEGPLIAYVSKLVDTTDSENFYALVRVLSGSIKENQLVSLLGESYSLSNQDDYKVQKISKCYLWSGRYKVEVPELNAGSIGLISGPGIDSFITKSATIYGQEMDESWLVFREVDQLFSPVFKVAVQAYNPKDLNKFLDCLKKLHRSYFGCEIKVEDSGEHSIFGFGELYMDCLLHDLRILYGDLEIKVSDPIVKFNETTDSLSKVKLVTKSNNGKNQISIIAEPLDPEISKDIRNGTLSIKRDTPRKFAKKLRDKYNWDSLAARSVWSFGPGVTGTSILCDDTLPDEVDKNLLFELKEFILKGFQWAVREGPLCEEPASDVKFRIINAQFAEDGADRNGAQIIQMVRKACHSALLIGDVNLLEPIYHVETISHVDTLNMLENFLDKRRGYIFDKERIDGTPLWKVNGFIPVIESVGVETELRLATQGKAYPQMVFSKWEKVPGNPLDDTAFIPLLKRVPLFSTSRDFMIKTRRRKGLSENVSLQKYVDEDTWEVLQGLGII